jgi:4-amino-4-deoxy-L-arabinose transferase-like glycosyltransferase
VRLAVGLLLILAAVKLLAHLLAILISPYGIHRDEFLYLSMGQHLNFWGMDFPPAIAVLAKISRALFGDALFGVRFFPALAGTSTLVLTGLLTRELGGGRFAQGLAMSALLLCALFLRPASMFMPVVFDQLWWTLGFWALIKLAQSPQKRWWLLLGAVGGLGLLTKFSIGFFAFAIFVGLLFSSQRSALVTRWPYVAALIALLVGSASLIGQIRLDFPVVIHMRELQTYQLRRVTYADFFAGQLMMLGPAILLPAAGLSWLLAARGTRPYRAVGWACVAAFILLLLLHGKAYYIGPIYPMLFAAGAAALGTLPLRTARVANGLMLSLTLIWGAIGLPFGLPIVPPPQMARYAAAVGIKGAVTTNQGKVLSLPQDYADMLGWEDQVRAVAQVYESLSADRRAGAVLIARNYGQAGALEFYGPRYSLPRVLMPQNYLLWPPPAKAADTVVTLGISTNDLARFFRSVKVAALYDDPRRVPEERNCPICVGETLYGDINEAWPDQKRWQLR